RLRGSFHEPARRDAPRLPRNADGPMMRQLLKDTVRGPSPSQIEVGMRLPDLVWQPTTVQLFRFSAVTWNAHRIHYDRDSAADEGYPGVLVQAHLHGAMLARMITGWMGPRGRLRAMSWEN